MMRKRTISREPDNNNDNNQKEQQQQQQQDQDQVDIESGRKKNSIIDIVIKTTIPPTTLLNSTAAAAREAAIKAANRNFGQNIDLSHSPTERCEEGDNIRNDDRNNVNAVSNLQAAHVTQTVTENTEVNNNGQNQPNDTHSTQQPQQTAPSSDPAQTHQPQPQPQQQETKPAKKKSKSSRTSNEYNPRWKGYTFIMVLSLINLSAVSNVRDSIQSSATMRNISDGYFEGLWGMHMVFGSATFAYSLLVLISDRLQIGIYVAKDESKRKRKKDDEADDDDDTEMISYMKLFNGQLEGYCLLFATVWWIIGVSFQTQVHGIAYLALNIYFSSWLSLVSCIYTLEEWSKSKDILSFVELTGLSETLLSWYILFISSLVVTGTSINMAVMPYMNEFSRETMSKDVGGPPIIIFDSIKITSPTALGIAFGIVSTITSAGFILVHYNLIELCSEGGWIELAATVSLILLWVIGVSIITQNDSVGATIVGVPYQEIFTPLVNDTQRTARSTLRERYQLPKKNSSTTTSSSSTTTINNMDPIFLGLTNYYLQTEIDKINLKKSLYASYTNESSSTITTTTTTITPSISPSESTFFIAADASTNATTGTTTTNDTTTGSTIQMMNSSALSTVDYSRKQLFWNQSSSSSNFNNTLVPLPTFIPIIRNNTTNNNTNITLVPTIEISSSPSFTPSDTTSDTPSDTPSSMPSLSPSTVPSITPESLSIQPSTLLPTNFMNDINECVIVVKNISFDCNTFIPSEYITRKVAIPGSNLYVFVWICLLSSINIALRWKASQAIQFAKNAEEQQRKKEQQRQQQFNHHQRKKQQQQQQFATTNVGGGGGGADINDDTNFDYEDDVEITFSSDNPTDITNRRRNNSTSNPLPDNINSKNYTMNNNQYTFDDIDGMDEIDDGYYSDEFVECDEY